VVRWLAFAMLLLAGQAQAADWQFVGSNNTGKYYIDRSSVRWLSTQSFTIMTNVMQRDEAELQTQIKIECGQDTYTYMHGRETRKDKVISKFDKPRQPEAIVAGSMPHELKAEYCDAPDTRQATWESIGKSKISEVFYDKSSIKQSSDGERFVADTKVVPFDNKEQTYSRMLFNCTEKTFIVLRLSKQKDGKQQQIFDKPQPPTPTSKTATLDKLANLYCGKAPQPAVNASEQACSEALEIVQAMEEQIRADIAGGGMRCGQLDSYLQSIRDVQEVVQQYQCPIDGLDSFSQEIRAAGCSK
jgi:hypothetical protein